MGVELYFSNQLMPLADKLFDTLLPESDDGDILRAPVVIVPNMNLSKWIKLTFARKSAIFMNVSFHYLEDGLWRMLRSLDDEAGRKPELLDKVGLKILLLAILLNDDRQTAAMDPMKNYLRGPDGRRRVDNATRCMQIAQVLAHLFQEYGYHRADMIGRWSEETAVDDAVEASQRWLYRRMLDLKERMAADGGPRLYTLDEYARRIVAGIERGPANRVPAPERFHFFGLSQLSPFHIDLLAHLSARYDIRIYSLNPSREYWEDIKTPSEKRWFARKTARHLKISDSEQRAGDLFTAADHPLLSAWGKPGRESVRLLCQLTDYDFHAGFAAPPRPDTLLGALGRGLLTLDNVDEERAPMVQDRSLQIVACPGIRREVETVYNSILHNLETDAQLLTTDIAVMVTDMARYKPVIDSIFGRQPSRIAYNLVDAQARTESRFAQAVLALMALAQGPFSRKAVFDLLRNPCVMQRWSYDPDTLAVWIGWTDALGVFHDYENPGSEAAEVHPAGPFSWRQGLERLRLSRIMTASASEADTAHYRGIAPFSDIHSGDQRLLEKFSMIIEGLHVSLTALKRPATGIRDWRDTFFQTIEHFMAISSEMRGEEAVFQSLVEAFERLADADARLPAASAIPASGDVMWAFVKSHLDGVTGGHGDYLTGGVTVSALLPMRPIPFKIVYVLGLEEGRFPGRTPESRLDLRTRARRIGDITLTERNRYLFLEILISVARKLYLSYVSRDLQKDRDQAPCSVVHQLRRYVEQALMGGTPFEVARVPISADHPCYLSSDIPTAWSDVLVNSSTAQRISAYRRYGLWADFEVQASEVERTRASAYRPDFTPPAGPVLRPVDGPVALTTGQLRRFLLDPVSTIGRFHLNIGDLADPTAELAEREEEPLASQFPIDYRLRMTPLSYWLANPFQGGKAPTMGDLAYIFDDVYADFSRKSLVPAGAFAAHDKSALKTQVLGMGTHLLPFIARIHDARRRYLAIRVGDAVDDTVTPLSGESLDFESAIVTLPPSASGRPDRDVVISGSLPWVWMAADGDWHCLVATPANRKPRVADRYVIAPLLLMMCLAAGGARVSGAAFDRLTAHVVYRDHVLALAYDLTSAAAGDYLADLVDAFLTPTPLIWLPFERVAGDRGLRARICSDTVSAEARETFRGAMEALLKETSDPLDELLGAVVTPDILDRARQRFRPIMVAE